MKVYNTLYWPYVARTIERNINESKRKLEESSYTSLNEKYIQKINEIDTIRREKAIRNQKARKKYQSKQL